MRNQAGGIAIKEAPDSAVPVSAELAILLPQTTLRVPANVFTLEGFRAWATSDESPDKAKITFLDGDVIIDMSGEDVQNHALVRSAICGPLWQLTTKKNTGMLFFGGALITNVEAGVSNIPDGVLVTWESIHSGRARIVARREGEDRFQEIEGTPDWVLEIVSDSSVGKDTRHLREAYHRAGISEYWLVDVRGGEISFQILLYQPSGYSEESLRGGWQRSEVYKRLFRLQQGRNPAGLWQYTLQAKAIR